MTTTLHIFINGLSCESFQVQKETAKALLLQRDGAKYPLWVPKSALVEEKFTIPGGPTETLLHLARWFSPEKAWQRIALGLTC